jgi:N-acetylmuramoyl-L-alanine amidase
MISRQQVTPRQLIVVDPGHGGADPGAVARVVNGSSVTLVEEEDINLAIGLRLERHLDASGFAVILTRRSDVHPSNGTRAALANKHDADAYVALHCNAAANPAAAGEEVLYGSGCAGGHALALHLADALDLETNIAPRPRSVVADADVGRGNSFRLSVLHRTRCPAALVEVGFLTNAPNRAVITSAAGQEAIAEAICNGVVKFFEGTRSVPLQEAK